MAKDVKDLDPHREAVYSWEDSWPGWGRNHLSLKECETLVHAACDAHKVPRPSVSQHQKRSFSWSIPSKNLISIQGGEHRGRGGRNVATVLHEAAHHIAWHLYGERIQDHGPTFLGVYLELLIRARVAPKIALESTARSFKLKWKYDRNSKPK